MNAQRLILHCMNVTVPGTNFWQFRSAIQKPGNAAVAKSDYQTFAQLHMALKYGLLADREPLIDVFHRTYNLKSSRIHDRVYAIMHLADDFKENDIEVDYNKTASQVMIDAADHHIRRHRNLRFLDASFHTDFGRNRISETQLGMLVSHLGPTQMVRAWPIWDSHMVLLEEPWTRDHRR